MRKFEPKKPLEVLGIGGRWTDYFTYLAGYIVEYFGELSEELQKEASK